MRINEIFYSIQGEGVHQGIPMVFVRLQGCNLIPHCSYCDTKYAQADKEGKEVSVDYVVEEVTKLLPYYKGWVCITGGEPLWQEEELEKLVRKLKQGGYQITIETNGSFKLPRWYTLVDSWSADIKCPSSGVCGVSREDWLHTRICDQIKLVVGNTEDLIFVQGVIKRPPSPTVLVSPITNILIDGAELRMEEYWNREWLQEVWEFCLENRVRWSLQQHKIVWGNKIGV